MKKRIRWLDQLPALLTGLMIIIVAIWRQQTFFKTLPTLITLVVQILNAHADRRSFLLGGCNAVLYGISYLSEGLYFSLISALCISAPIQIYSYFSWGRHSQKSRPELRFLGHKSRLLIILAILISWGICYFGLAPLFAGATYPAVDAFGFGMGIAISLMAAKRYIDSQFFNIVSCTIHLVVWVLLAIRNPSNFNYVVISAYNLFRVTEAAVIWTRTYFDIKKAMEETTV